MIVVREHIRPRAERFMTMSELEKTQSELEKVNKWGNNLTFLLMHHFKGGGMVSHYVQTFPGQPPPRDWSGDTDYFEWARSIYPKCPYNAGLIAPRPMGKMKFVRNPTPKASP